MQTSDTSNIFVESLSLPVVVGVNNTAPIITIGVNADGKTLNFGIEFEDVVEVSANGSIPILKRYYNYFFNNMKSHYCNLSAEPPKLHYSRTPGDDQ